MFFEVLLVHPLAIEYPSEVYEPLSLARGLHPLSHEHLSLFLACQFQFQFHQAGDWRVLILLLKRNVIIVVNLALTVALK